MTTLVGRWWVAFLHPPLHSAYDELFDLLRLTLSGSKVVAFESFGASQLRVAALLDSCKSRTKGDELVRHLKGPLRAGKAPTVLRHEVLRLERSRGWTWARAALSGQACNKPPTKN